MTLLYILFIVYDRRDTKERNRQKGGLSQPKLSVAIVSAPVSWWAYKKNNYLPLLATDNYF